MKTEDAAARERSGEPLEVEHRRFGRITVPPADVVRFGGLPGFPEADRFTLLHEPESAYGWLVSLDDPDLAFAVIDPRGLFPDYAPEIEPSSLACIDAEPGDVVELLAIATVREGQATLNLAAPLLVNPRNRLAAQVLLTDESLPMRAPLPEPKMEAKAAPEARPQIESKPQT